MPDLRDRLTGWRAAALLALAAVLIWLAARGLPDGRLHVYFLDVGQGDAIFVQTPDGRQILVDGGPSPQALLQELGALMPFWDHDLDLVVLTHPDQDHQAGLLAVLDRYAVGRMVETAEAESQTSPPVWQEHLRKAAVRAETAERGMQLATGGVVLSVLHPAPARLRGTPADDNNNGMVLRLDYGQVAFLLVGDAEVEAEGALLHAGLPLQAQVLKVGHHGSSRSSSAAFLAAVKPQLAVIQVGRANRFGHPHPSVLQRLRDTKVLRTDQVGRVEVISDGQGLWVQTARDGRQNTAE